MVIFKKKKKGEGIEGVAESIVNNADKLLKESNNPRILRDAHVAKSAATDALRLIKHHKTIIEVHKKKVEHHMKHLAKKHEKVKKAYRT
jgi:hypothetical protein